MTALSTRLRRELDARGQRRMTVMEAATVTACETCGAEADAECRSSYLTGAGRVGTQPANSPHSGRIHRALATLGVKP